MKDEPKENASEEEDDLDGDDDEEVVVGEVDAGDITSNLGRDVLDQAAKKKSE